MQDVEYQTVQAYSANELDKKVNKFLKDGWDFQGGVATAYEQHFAKGSPGAILYSQAMVKVVQR